MLGGDLVRFARSQMYGFEDQWGDLVIDPASGKKVTESAYIRSQGKVPLKNNVIRPILKNIDGQFRNNQTKPVCVVRDKRESIRLNKIWMCGFIQPILIGYSSTRI